MYFIIVNGQQLSPVKTWGVARGDYEYYARPGNKVECYYVEPSQVRTDCYPAVVAPDAQRVLVDFNAK